MYVSQYIIYPGHLEVIRIETKMKVRTRALLQLILSPAAIVSLAACSPEATRAAPDAVPAPVQQYRLAATIHDLMEGIVDPSADALWDSVAFISTASGTEDRQPRTDQQWKDVRTSAITLIEAANLLSMPGRRVAADSPDSVPVGVGELSHDEMQQRIGATHEAFAQFARNLQDAGLKALAAIDARNAQGLMDAGGTIDEACEACHVVYWYPNQQRPGP
jgi:hypothetical protein